MTIATDSKDVNLHLSFTLLLTTIGDWLSYFSVLTWTNDLTFNPRIAALTVLIKAIGSVVGSVCFPYLTRLYHLRLTLIASQLASGVLIFLLFTIWKLFPDTSYISILFLFFLQSIFSQMFNVSKEAYSKATVDNDNLTTEKTHQNIQAMIENGTAIAQIFGPIFFLVIFLMLDKTSIGLCFIIDIFSFILSGLLLFRLPLIKTIETKSSIFGPFSFFRSNCQLRHIFLIRSTLLIISVWLANFLVFPIIAERYNLSISLATIPYTLIGIGKYIGNNCISNTTSILPVKIVSSYIHVALKNKNVTFWLFFASLLFGVSNVMFSFGSYLFGAFGSLLFGFSNGIQITLSRAYTKNHCGNANIGEIFALEGVLGQAVSTLVFFIYYSHTSINGGIFVVFLFSIFTAIAFYSLSNLSRST